ncbi:predicted protein [Sclerotinia sclerotiorum 1980 UF-70]|uniref:Uncharacterized protein n=1 Tax=Sclerotinia sclerotiorum (strain ATCC 18683 / 1980 / Ss-1) TaxID=665079 RepID=A7ELM9_SCLS1|nr:predicted protein [Sclerotinia sclerotiorum 1980 UF-70]EDO03745.1 predicted protein [Sclerotinia sclerotiorum 1980 UF-70]
MQTTKTPLSIIIINLCLTSNTSVNNHMSTYPLLTSSPQYFVLDKTVSGVAVGMGVV